MSVISSTDLTSAVSSYTSSSSSSNVLGQEDFLELLVAQLENQDPLEPQSNTEFVAQLAEFSSLEQQTLTNDKLDEVVASTQSNNTVASLSLLGQEVIAQTDSFVLQGDTVDVGFYLDDAAEQVSVNILDSSNSVVASFDFNDVQVGENFATWDGCDANGNRLASDEYQIAVNIDGGLANSEAALVRSTVNEVGFDAVGNTLGTSAGVILLSEILSVVAQ
ncbi:MAG: flagellar hook assembly protein FlgD [Desulfuromonas sp.]|nr:flagellar hook assembly protein FlgD [Desulfuromonas sp.]